MMSGTSTKGLLLRPDGPAIKFTRVVGPSPLSVLVLRGHSLSVLLEVKQFVGDLLLALLKDSDQLSCEVRLFSGEE